ncbi:MAG: DUF885 domain-containing protein, partial [Myxococcales bacterium]|nr:DUF885 domain-containing protein [Myxococcales bacterium]
MTRWLLAISAIAIGLGCGGAQTVRPDPGSAWPDFADAFIDAYFEIEPSYAVWSGRHEFDGRLPDWSAAGVARSAHALRDWRGRALAFEASALSADERLEREHLVAVTDDWLFWNVRAKQLERNPAAYRGALSPSVYLTLPYAPLEERMRAFVRYQQAVPAAVAQLRENLRTPLPRTYVELGLSFFGGLASYFESDVPGIFAGVEDEALQQRFAASNRKAAASMRAVEAWLRAELARATDDFALGAELFSEMLWSTERVDIPLDELKRMGNADLERNLAAIRAACAQVTPGQSIPKCVETMQADKPAAGPVAGATQQLAALKAFVQREDVVSIPGTEDALVAEAPPYQRSNAAYIEIPGPYEKDLPATYYIAPPDPAWSEAEQRAYLPGRADLMFVSIHEVWPGHFLQFLHANRSSSRIGRVFVGYAFAEGWAHYSEELMWELGFGDGDPKLHVGQLINALLRNVRLLSAIGLHTGDMTVAASEAMFREMAYQDPGNARQQAARGTYDPAYLNYTLGKLLIRELRDDWSARRGGR